MINKWDIFDILNWEHYFYYEPTCQIHTFKNSSCYESSDDLYDKILRTEKELKEEYNIESLDGELLINLLYLVQDFKFDDVDFINIADKHPSKEDFLEAIKEDLENFQEYKDSYSEEYYNNVIKFITDYIEKIKYTKEELPMKRNENAIKKLLSVVDKIDDKKDYNFFLRFVDFAATLQAFNNRHAGFTCYYTYSEQIAEFIKEEIEQIPDKNDFKITFYCDESGFVYREIDDKKCKVPYIGEIETPKEKRLGVFIISPRSRLLDLTNL